MNGAVTETPNESSASVAGSVLLYWVAYVAITLGIGFATSMTIRSEVWQLTAWGFISSIGLLLLVRQLMRKDEPSRAKPTRVKPGSSWRGFALGLLLGMASFGIHLLVIVTLAGPITFELAPGVGVLAVLIFFLRFLSTSCMEELGFRSYPLQRLTAWIGPLPAVAITAVVFGCSHFLYGWNAQTIALGVIPAGLLWGMSAIATKGIAVPIGLHAAWNFSGWVAGSRAEVGPLSMTIDDAAFERAQAVGTVSYLLSFGVLTVAFWLLHRRNVRNDAQLASQGA